jgi:hypothetical protein
VNEYQIRSRVEDCFSGEIPRECDTCPARDMPEHCCFGDQYDDYDYNHCQKCIHRDDCRAEYFAREARRPLKTVTSGVAVRQPLAARGITTTQRPSRVRMSTANRAVAEPMGQQGVAFPATPPVIQPHSAATGSIPASFDKGTAREVGKGAVWNALRGIFYYVSEFFRTHYWS